jgi:hypothetical protein
MNNRRNGGQDQSPIVIGGPDRCGKTTMRAFLVSHPNISIPSVGSNMWTYFYGQYGDLSRHRNFERCLDAMMRYKHVRFLKPDPDRIRKEFYEGEASYARLFALFQEHHAERAGKPRWGDQTGLVERYADQIFAAYPGAKMIHMLRDPRDRYEASLARWPKGKARAGGAIARWFFTSRLAQRNLKRYPDRYKIVYFEELLRRPEHILRDVCKFLNEDFTPRMLTMEGAIGFRDKITDANYREGQVPLSPGFIGQFRQRLSKFEIAFMQDLAKRSMVRHGYQLEPLFFSAWDHLRYYSVNLPINLLRLVAWYGVEWIQHNFPLLAGRKPRAAMRLE